MHISCPRLRLRNLLFGVLLTCPLGLGCITKDMINDPNLNAKIRYLMSQHRAKTLLHENGSQLTPYTPQYSLEVFWKKKKNGDDEELYDYLKTSPLPGPDRFVIVYDFRTRKTFIRTDLRSEQDLDRLPEATSQEVHPSTARDH